MKNIIFNNAAHIYAYIKKGDLASKIRGSFYIRRIVIYGIEITVNPHTPGGN